MSNADPWVLTFTGRRFSLLRPRAEDVNIVDIIVALSRICRYTGHCGPVWTVLEHSLFVWWLLRQWGEDVETQLAGLFHDGTEAYTGDASSPLKQAMRQIVRELYAQSGEESPFDVIEDRVMGAIAERFRLPLRAPVWARVKQADMVALATEGRDLITQQTKDVKLWVSNLPEPDSANIHYTMSMICRELGLSQHVRRQKLFLSAYDRLLTEAGRKLEAA